MDTVLDVLGFGEEQQESKAFNPDEQICSAAPGDYQVHVTVIEARNLPGVQIFSFTQFKKGATSEDRLPDSQVKVRLRRADGRATRQKTPVRKSTSTPLFESHLFFDMTVGPGELSWTTLSFEVFDTRLIGADQMIGSVDLDLESVYNLPDHEMHRKWMTLLDPKGRRIGPQGTLLISVQVTGEHDTMKPHSKDDEEDETVEMPLEGDDVAALQPASVDMELYHFKFELYKGRDLPRMDRFGAAGIDAMVRLQSGSSKPVTSKVKTSNDPTWNQRLVLNMRVPLQKGINPQVMVSVMDKDYGGGSDVVATFRIALRDVVINKEKYKAPRWHPLYGAPRSLDTAIFGGSSKLQKKMNRALVPGSEYRGSILFSCTAKAAEYDELVRRQKVPGVDLTITEPRPSVLLTEIYDIDLTQLEEGVDGKIQAKVCYAMEDVASKWVLTRPEKSWAKNDCHAAINQRLLLPILVPWERRKDNIEFGSQAPDVFVEVHWKGRGAMGGSRRRIGYARIPMVKMMPAQRVFNPESLPTRGEPWPFEGWVELHSDALASRGRGSTTLRHHRPLGHALVRCVLQEPQVFDESSSSESGNSDESFLSSSSEEDEEDLLDKLPPKKAVDILPMQTRLFTITFHIYQGIDLPAQDAEGTSDPYVLLRVGRKLTRTQVVPSTTAPSWFAMCKMDVELPIHTIDHSKSKSSNTVLDRFIAGAEKASQALMSGDRSGLSEAGRPERDRLEAGPGSDNRHFTTALPAGGKLPTLGTSGGSMEDDLRTPAEPETTIGMAEHQSNVVRGTAPTATEMMNVNIRIPSMPERTHLPDEIGAEHLAVDGFDEDDYSEDSSEISSTLSADDATRHHRRIEGDVMWWACPRAVVSVCDADKVGDDAVMCVAFQPIVPDGCLVQPPYPADDQITPQWVVMRRQDSLGPGGKVLIATAVDSRDNANTKKYLRPASSALVTVGKEMQERVPRTDFSNSLLLAFNKEKRDLLSQGSKDVYALKLDTIPVVVDILVVGVRRLSKFLSRDIRAPKVEVELTGAMPLEGARLKHHTLESSEPAGDCANYAGQVLSIRGSIPKQEECAVALIFRVKESIVGKVFQIATCTVVPDIPGIKTGKGADAAGEFMHNFSDDEDGYQSEDSAKAGGSGDDAPASDFEEDEESAYERQKRQKEKLKMERRKSRRASMIQDTLAKDKDKKGKERGSDEGQEMEDMDPDTSINSSGKESGKSAKSGKNKEEGKKKKNKDASKDGNAGPKEGEEGAGPGEGDPDEPFMPPAARGKPTRQPYYPEEEEGKAKKALEALKSKFGGKKKDDADEEEDNAIDDSFSTFEAPEYMKRRDLVSGRMEDYLDDIPFRLSTLIRGSGGEIPRTVGYVKYMYQVRRLKERNSPEESTDTEKASDQNSESTESYYLPKGPTIPFPKSLIANLEHPQQVTIRIYLLQGVNLMPKDSNGLCDPYVLVDLGGKTYGSRDEYISKTIQPSFYKMIQVKALMPGKNDLTFTVMDWDKYTSDELIGKATIDLEDRWFSAQWRAMMAESTQHSLAAPGSLEQSKHRPMPVELVNLYNKGSQPQGQLEMWIEIHPYDQIHSVVPTDISPPPPVPVELRVCVFDAREMTSKDVLTNQNDLYIRTTVQGIDQKGVVFSNQKETDVHWLASTGRGSFNYRNIHNFSLPLRNPRLKIQAFDRDITAKDDSIGEMVLPLRPMISKLLAQIKKGDALNATIPEPKPNPFNFGKNWYKVFHPSKPGVCQGQVSISMMLMTQERADRFPAGEGRQEPNRDPKLLEPDREKLSLTDPMGSLATIIGPERLRQVMFLLCCGCCCAVAVLGAGVLLNDFISAYINAQLNPSAPAPVIYPTPAPDSDDSDLSSDV